MLDWRFFVGTFHVMFVKSFPQFLKDIINERNALETGKSEETFSVSHKKEGCSKKNPP